MLNNTRDSIVDKDKQKYCPGLKNTGERFVTEKYFQVLTNTRER